MKDGEETESHTSRISRSSKPSNDEDDNCRVSHRRYGYSIAGDVGSEPPEYRSQSPANATDLGTKHVWFH
jgi:hypothetical protein